MNIKSENIPEDEEPKLEMKMKVKEKKD